MDRRVRGYKEKEQTRGKDKRRKGLERKGEGRGRGGGWRKGGERRYTRVTNGEGLLNNQNKWYRNTREEPL